MPSSGSNGTPETLARPEGFEHTPPTIVIEGSNEMVQALLAA
jgi:hypothetical protein